MPVERRIGNAAVALPEPTHLFLGVGEEKSRVLDQLREADDTLAGADELYRLPIEAQTAGPARISAASVRSLCAACSLAQMVDDVAGLQHSRVPPAPGDQCLERTFDVRIRQTGQRDDVAERALPSQDGEHPMHLRLPRMRRRPHLGHPLCVGPAHSIGRESAPGTSIPVPAYGRVTANE